MTGRHRSDFFLNSINMPKNLNRNVKNINFSNRIDTFDVSIFLTYSRCAPESELGFPGLAGCGPTLRQDGAGMAYLKSSPYAVNGLTLPMPMDGLHTSMGYPTGKKIGNI